VLGDSVVREQFPVVQKQPVDPGSGVFGRKIQNTVLAYVVFWYSGVLDWRP
jgi:hypothetical protein